MSGYVLTLKYDGTDFCGWQFQPNARTVQTELQNGCEKVFGFRPSVTGCSRTDSGVHAKGFVALVGAENTIPEEGLIQALNSALPDDIAVTHAKFTEKNFHPRYDAKGKEYIYTVRNSKIRDPFSDRFAWLYGRKIDVDLANKLCKEFVGTHDFKAFMAAGSKIVDSVRTVKYFEVARENEDVIFRVAADGFLYNMVRIMVGTVVGAASGIKTEPIKDIIEGLDRAKAGLTAPAKGLCLNKVFYDTEF